MQTPMGGLGGPPTQSPPPMPPPPPAPRAASERGVVKIRVFTLIVGGLLLLITGFTHVVYGGNVGITVCAKDGWSLGDTFVDLDDFIGKPLLANLDRARVLRAMFSCGTLQRPEL